MILKSIAAVLAAVIIGLSFTSCAETDSSSDAESSKAQSSAAESSQAESKADDTASQSSSGAAASTDYDVNGDFRAYDAVREKYKDGYSLNMSYMNNALGSHGDVEITWTGDKAYYSTSIDGMKSYVVIPGDGKAYRVNEGTTTYQEQEATENQAMMNDLLINPAGEFDHAAIGENNMVFEYYNINEAMGGEGQIVYGFNGETYDLNEIVVVTNGDEMTASYYYVNELTEPDESKVAVPDLSAYTKE